MVDHEKSGNYRLGIFAGVITFIGTLISGPITFLGVSAIKPQPEWISAQVYVENYHPIQSVTFYFGFLLILGSVMMIAFIHYKQKSSKSLLAVIFTAIAAGLISFNYSTEATIIPALVRNYSSELDPIIQILAVTNPYSIFWSIEMWGYGFLGLGTLLAMGYFRGQGIEGWAKALFLANGILSIVGALITGIYVEWVLSTVGLVSYALWNVLYMILAILFLLVLKRRAREKVANH